MKIIIKLINGFIDGFRKQIGYNPTDVAIQSNKELAKIVSKCTPNETGHPNNFVDDYNRLQEEYKKLEFNIKELEKELEYFHGTYIFKHKNALEKQNKAYKSFFEIVIKAIDGKFTQSDQYGINKDNIENIIKTLNMEDPIERKSILDMIDEQLHYIEYYNHVSMFDTEALKLPLKKKLLEELKEVIGEL